MSMNDGLIIFGKNNIIEENAIIINKTIQPLIIGDGNHFGVRSVFEGVRMGSNCTLEAKSRVSPGTTIGDDCIIGVHCSTRPDETLPNNTIIFGTGRRTQPTSQNALHQRHLDYLHEVLPKYHHVKTSIP
ncbi:hypothetical protein SmJEL517_g03498 [Synchytrium microbalum]|uniref:Dynactin subunit 6 n=1 Tax=Synchytrium microbalum TaxID=1806994 RepID=A0A507C6T3_9FUNG|nr:uncharacterized protein SmJEL517_g03498 [Synchytrium microbalum]TPX33686.1 hypothetical protein SmJEL517_g03498 [Synchytrium microbalum]